MAAKPLSDGTMDAIYGTADFLLKEGEFQAVNMLLRCLTLKRMSVDEILTWLTVTLPAKKQINSRDDFYCRAEAELKARGFGDKERNELLMGLS